MRNFSRIVLLDPVVLSEEQWNRLRSYAKEVVDFTKQNTYKITGLSVRELNDWINGADAIITCWKDVPDEVILANPQLEYIGVWSNLAAHRVNFKLAKQRKILVTCIPDYGTDSVAELTFGGILALSRQLLRAHRDTLRGRWPYELLKTRKYIPKVSEIPTKTLRNKCLGIVGLGRIGKRVAEIALAFRMNVLYWSRKRHLKYEEKGLEYKPLDELFSTSDIVTIHLSPYAPTGIISADLIRSLKDGAFFINTSSGSLVDQRALFEELTSERIFAFLDVYEGLPPRKIMKSINSLNNLFIYRSGWYTQEAITYKGEYLLRSMEKFLEGIPQPAAWDQEGLISEDLIELPCVKLT